MMSGLPDTGIRRPTETSRLPSPIEAFFRALNRGDVSGIVKQIANDAVINDQMLEMSGRDKILPWAKSDLVGCSMRAELLSVRARESSVIVSAKITGNFNAPGLPEPLILLFYFVLHDALIEQLIILRADL